MATTEADVDGWLSASPLYCALIWSIPTEDKVICVRADPLVIGTVMPPLKSQKVIVPVSGFGDVTVAVAATEPPCGTLLLGTLIAILVGTWVVPPPPPPLDEREPPPHPSAATITKHPTTKALTR